MCSEYSWDLVAPTNYQPKAVEKTRYKHFSLILIGLGPIVLKFPYISVELTDKAN
jgi:hypothetical protein